MSCHNSGTANQCRAICGSVELSWALIGLTRNPRTHHINLKNLSKSLWLLVVLVLVILALQARSSGESALINAQLLTLDPARPVASALLIRGERIVAVGSEEDVLAEASSTVSIIDMKGRTVVPGFVDAHSHFPVSGLAAVSVNVAPPPVGPGDSKEALLETIRRAIPSVAAEDDSPLILGFNYDNTAFDIPVHPTRLELDAVSRGYPVYLWHNSGHLGVANSAALKRLGIDESSPPIEGGERGRYANGVLSGLLLEKAAPPMTALIKHLSWRDQWRIITGARDEYLAAGVTTVQNGYASMLMSRLLSGLHRIGILPQRVITWLAHDKLDPAQIESLPSNTTIKILVDGSPQGLTAYMSEPYRIAATGPRNAGIEIYRQTELDDLVLKYHAQGLRLALHGNGDAAIEQIISAITAAQREAPRADARHLLVHAQLLRPDQIEKMAAIGLHPTFFTAHSFFWGDWHLRSLGQARAEGISPAATALKNGLRISVHADTPVTPMDVMLMMWAASERKTRSGALLGGSERIGREAALKAVTIDAAWQAFRDHEIGSLEVGKLADLAVLSENPITAKDIRHVLVEETWIGGRRHDLSDGP